MVLIYAHKQTPRLAYIVRFLFSSVLGVPVSITSDAEEFRNSKLPRINYSGEALNGIHIYPQGLLFEQGVKPIVPESFIYQGIPVLFPTQNSGALPFDPFAAAFFMITRYEEYLSQALDLHHRFLPTGSVAYKHHFLDIPVVDHWALLLRSVIQQQYPDYPFPQRTYRYVPTIDVDIAYAYKYRGLYRTAGAAAKSLLKGNFTDNRHRFNTLFLNRRDPFDTFPLLRDWHNQHHLTPTFFFLVGQYGRYDKNLSPHHPTIRELIRQTSNYYPTGVHPSYQSNFKDNSLKNEIQILADIVGSPVTRSRQHFLMLRFPDTYQRLIEQGITEDYTMGYAQMPGFRAGTCTPFSFYNLTTESETSLIVYPFQVMDVTLNQYLKLSTSEAVQCIRQLNSAVRKVNGTFISLWHNESLSEMRNWANWQEVYKTLLQIAS